MNWNASYAHRTTEVIADNKAEAGVRFKIVVETLIASPANRAGGRGVTVKAAVSTMN